MFAQKTITNYLYRLDKAISAMRESTDLSVIVSKGNRKIGKCLNVSVAPIRTCGGNCKVCMCACYDMKACMQYPNVLQARAKNTVLAMYARDDYFRQIDEVMNKRRKNKVFRWHVGGDIPDYDYFCRMIENARNHPDFIIWTYTKQYDIVNDYVRAHGGTIKAAIPDNLSIMFSVWKGLYCDNPYGFATFTCVDIASGETFEDGVHHCNGACKDCITGKTGCPFRKSSATKLH